MQDADDKRTDPSEEAGSSKPAEIGPGLHLVATPIGNLRDITLRALDTLRAADLIACEDTRVTAKLLARFAIATPLAAYNDHNAAEARPALLRALAEGKRVALVSDAGTPLVADPGYRLVRAAQAQGTHVTCAPGPSAALAALSLSGLPSDRFLFAGFLPARPNDRRRAIAEVAATPATLLFFEAPHRLVEALADLAELLGGRDAAVARELTKRFEEVRRAALPDLAHHYAAAGPPKGEIVIAVGPPSEGAVASHDAVDAALREAMLGAGVKDAAAEVAARLGRPRREVYARALELRRLAGAGGP